MKTTTVQRWGHSLAVRIPKSFACELRVDAGSEVRLRVAEGTLVVEPLRSAPTLEALLAGVTLENTPGDVAWAPPEGREGW